RERLVEHRLRAIDEQDRAAVGIVAAVEQVAGDFDVLAKDVLSGIGGKADEVEVRYARPFVLEVGPRLVEQLRLLDENVFCRRVRRLRYLRQRLRQLRGVKPRLARPDCQRREEEQQPGPDE